VSENAESRHDQEALRAELEASRARLETLSRELQVIDGSLDDMSEERQQYSLVQEACGALEKLDQMGGSELFWSNQIASVSPELHIGGVRRRIDEFETRLHEIEGRRKSLLERIRAEQDNNDYIEDDIAEAEAEEEQKKLEWVIEREMDALPETEPIMPWTRGGEEDRRFRKSLLISLLISLLLALITPMIDLPIPDKWEPVEVSERFTRLIKEVEPPPPPVVQEKAPEEEELKPEVSEEEPQTTPKPAAAKTGILAFREQFSSLAEAKPSARLGAAARIDRSGEAAIGQQGRSLVATQAPGSSGGINIASISRDTVGGGGQALEGVEVGQATSSIRGIAGPERPLSGGPGPGRTDEEIQIVFDRHKAALYRLYNRELRRDPTLQGQIVLRITIEPDGSVSLCEVKSSDMKAPELAAQVASRVGNFDFGAKEGIPAITILYPIDFLPAT